MCEKISAITIKEFVEKLAAGGGLVPSPADCVEYGCSFGWLEAGDVAAQDEVLLRKHAARIIHNFLRLELKEADDIDGSPAYVLQDLFDCRVCAGHIIQVYVKGIMNSVARPDGGMIFSAEDVVSREEAEEILLRTLYPGKRVSKRTVTEKFNSEPKIITAEEAAGLLKKNRQVRLVDVRPERAFFEKHYPGAFNIPFLNILKNPYAVCENRDTILLLYCEEGMQSEAAARCLLEAGYLNVACFAWKEAKEESGL